MTRAARSVGLITSMLSQPGMLRTRISASFRPSQTFGRGAPIHRLPFNSMLGVLGFSLVFFVYRPVNSIGRD
jgi:hypothetical protein